MAKLTYEQALAKLYTKAETDLIKTIRRKTAYGNATAYERSLLRQVDEQIKALQKSSDTLVQKLIISNYKKGLDRLVSDLSADNTAPRAYSLMSRLNSNQINIIVDNLTQQLNMAAATVGRRCDDMIRQVTLEAMAKKLTQGKTIREMQKELEKRLENQNITSVTYSNGAEHNIKDYASMAVRTATAKTQNTAQLVQGKEWGYDLVRMTSHYPTCEVCAMYQGRVYAVTKEAANGKYKDKDGNPLRFSYLYDTVLTEGYDTVHPNCRHRFSIFPPKAYTLDELAEFSRQSIQPFADTRSDAERKAYAKEQAVKRKRNASRRQYEKIKSCFPNDAPKTFAAWQKMKSANSQKYKDLLEDYRTLIKAVANSNDNGIIKSIDVDDYELFTYGKNIAPEVNDIILSTMKECEKDGKFVISEISTEVLPTSSGTPVLQIEPTANGLLKLNINADFLSGKSLQDINNIFIKSQNTVVNSLKEAIIHESGHAISIKGKTLGEITDMYGELAKIHYSGISDIAFNDGAECLAELEVLRTRKTIVPKKLADFYKKYMGREYL